MIYYIIFALIIILLLYMRIEASLLTTSFVNFSKGSKGLKIAHISDLHVRKLYISSKRIKAVLERIRPDAVIISGDYIDSQKDIPKFITLLEEINGVSPIYVSLGNHDHKAFKHDMAQIQCFIDQIHQTGATVLFNCNTNLSKNNMTYNLIGIDDLKHGKPDINKAFEGIKSSFRNSCLNIAFSHNPDMLFELPKEKVDYFLCGHFHGGQIWMPFGLEFKLMRKERLSKMGYKRGTHKVNGINIYINRGLGNVVFPFRFLSKPEIAVIQLP